ncbi:ATP-binding protein [Streptomyces sp. Qhu_M48]|uniref:ATP-binding protein n=1 Tax=Streptomyces sp. Qhu_M48 TaxID=3435889 RepID=UPI003F500F53
MVTFSHVGEGDSRASAATPPLTPDPRAALRAWRPPVSEAAAVGRRFDEGVRALERPTPPVEVLTVDTATSCPTGHPSYSQTLPRDARSAGVARRLVRTALTLWGLEALIEDAALVVTELVSNAVDHSRLASIRVIVARPSTNGVRVGVVDRSTTVPTLLIDVGDGETRGRGLLLVDALADRWETELYRWGKQVWAELRLENAL